MSRRKNLHLKYSDDLDDIKSASKCFDPDYDIDIRTNGGNIIVPPSSYYNENLKKQVMSNQTEKNKKDLQEIKKLIENKTYIIEELIGHENGKRTTN